MHLFAYNGKSSQEFMVNISGGDTWRKPAPIMETITVPGRNGQILNFTGSYENVDVPYHCGIGGDFDARYTAFINWLLSSPGYHQLEDSYHPDVFRMAAVSSVGDPSLTKLNRAGEFDISFNCKPQTFLKSGEKITFSLRREACTTQRCMRPSRSSGSLAREPLPSAPRR